MFPVVTAATRGSNRDQNGINARQRRGMGVKPNLKNVDAVAFFFFIVSKSATVITAEMRNVMGRDTTG